MFWFIAPPHEIVGRSLHKPRRPRAAAGRRHSCAMVGQHRPASPGWRRRHGAAHPASGRLVRPRRMPPTMGSRLRREGGAGQRRCPSRGQQRARRCACRAAEVVAQRPHGCAALRHRAYHIVLAQPVAVHLAWVFGAPKICEGARIWCRRNRAKVLVLVPPNAKRCRKMLQNGHKTAI